MTDVQRQIASRVAHHLADREVANLGIGIPTLVADVLLPGRQLVLETENGLLGVGPAPAPGLVDPALVNAGKLPVTALPGASYFSSSQSFGLIRGGHVGTAVLGATVVVAEAAFYPANSFPDVAMDSKQRIMEIQQETLRRLAERGIINAP